MKSILSETYNEIIISNSKFITLLYRVADVNDVKKILKNVKQDYKKADHYCYAYIINDIKKCSDDGEPSGTAGMPILSTLEKKNYNLVLCVVIRYFGGVKLGSGGLIRAYRKSVNECLKESVTVDLYPGLLVEIVFNLDNHNDVVDIIEDCKIVDRDYQEIITYKVIVDDDILEKVKRITTVNIIGKAFIEK